VITWVYFYYDHIQLYQDVFSPEWRSFASIDDNVLCDINKDLLHALIF
jgi:hypothetical protein